MRAARESEELIECMNDEDIYGTPPVIQAIRHETEKLGFTMASEPKTGSLLRAFAIRVPGERAFHFESCLIRHGPHRTLPVDQLIRTLPPRMRLVAEARLRTLVPRM